MSTSLDSAQRRLEEARAAAASRPVKASLVPEWPRVEELDITEALEELTFAMLLHGARVGFGVNDGSADVWCRISLPLECDHKFAGMVAFTTSTTLDRAARKAAQLLTEAGAKFWKPDKYTR